MVKITIKIKNDYKNYTNYYIEDKKITKLNYY